MVNKVTQPIIWSMTNPRVDLGDNMGITAYEKIDFRGGYWKMQLKPDRQSVFSFITTILPEEYSSQREPQNVAEKVQLIFAGNYAVFCPFEQ